MAVEIIMPKAGMAMESGTIIEWYKKPGDKVSAGEALLEIETDKVSMEVEAEASGYLLAILHDAGAQVPVITAIGWIGERNEPVPAFSADNSPRNQAVPLQRADTPLAAPSGNNSTENGTKTGALRATPAARYKARREGIPLSQLRASGRRGEIRLRDVVRGGAEDESCSQSLPAAGTTITRPLSAMRKTIAERMTESQRNIPPVTLTRPADVTALLELRKKLNQREEEKITLTDFIVKAVAEILKRSPWMRTMLINNELHEFEEIALGLAIALESGLIVPVIRSADRKNLGTLSREIKELSERARSGKLHPAELHGGVFTISNLGMYGITSFNPIINPPQSAILGVNAARQELSLHNGTLRERMMMNLSLTIDHRVLDGAQGALFLNELSGKLESPYHLLV
ncbi:MAG: hypothetical protein B0D92_06065 [Spirochaeta sp. LUC14_002_19_P3]|nr:MAG: hypothetical protein B0D92_06065 [Spirochaeta sp. LUC14_002_19_P3]